MKRQELLADLLERILSGKSTVEECSARYPNLAKELESLINIAANIIPDDTVPTREFREQARRHIAEEIASSYTKTTRHNWYFPRMRPSKALAAVIISLFIVLLAGGTTAYAAQRSLPGDALYPVKTGMEYIQLAITPGAGAKARVYLKLVQQRIEETMRQVKANREVSPYTIDTIGLQLDKAIIELNKVNNSQVVDEILGQLTSSTLEQQITLEAMIVDSTAQNKPRLARALSMTYRGNMIAEVAYNNRQYLSRLPSVTNDKVEDRQFMLDGTIISIQNRTWDVGGIKLNNVYSPAAPPPGKRVVIEGTVKGEEIFISRVDTFLDFSETTWMTGHFGGKNTDGTANISGVPVMIDDAYSTQLEQGDRVQLRGRATDGELAVIAQAGKLDYLFSGISQSGTLLSINISGTEITFSSAGNQITVNISEAIVIGEKGRSLRLIELRRMLGHHLKLEGLYRKGGQLYARSILVVH